MEDAIHRMFRAVKNLLDSRCFSMFIFRMLRLAIPLVVLALSACATKPPAPLSVHVPAGVGDSRARLVFPYGHYTHDVKLKIQGKKEFAFEGVVETRPDRIQLTALSPLQTTIMRVVEDRRTGDVTLNCYLSELRPYQSNFSDYYQLVRQVLILERNADDSRGQRRIGMQANGRSYEGELSDYRESIPRRIQIDDPRFSLTIQVAAVPAGAKP